MFISDKYEFVFFEVPRTASQSVTRVLMEFDPDSPTAIERCKQGWFVDYHAFHLSADLAESYRVFAAHRNPYSRLWSHWKHRNKYGNPDIFYDIAWPRYVEWVCDPSSIPEIQNAVVDVPISEMFDPAIVDFWISFETLDESWERLSDFLSVQLPPLQHSNATQSAEGFGDAFDADLAASVAQRFAADFERFDYDLDSWRTK